MESSTWTLCNLELADLENGKNMQKLFGSGNTNITLSKQKTNIVHLMKLAGGASPLKAMSETMTTTLMTVYMTMTITLNGFGGHLAGLAGALTSQRLALWSKQRRGGVPQ